MTDIDWNDPEGEGDGEAADVDRAPICSACGVTALPADDGHVLDTRFACENPDCESYGEIVG